jgi:alanine-glyoxylate transaminase/serine-glyoxylate transaminase/serine-pyruvate transaminase
MADRIEWAGPKQLSVLLRVQPCRGSPGLAALTRIDRDGRKEELMIGKSARGHDWRAFDEELSAVPGGTSLHPAVLRAMQRPYVNPWSTEFVAYFEETLELLKRLYNTRHDVLVMIGPIRLAMDAVVCSLLEPGERAAFAVNGHWSDLFTVIARAHGAIPIVLEEEWGMPINADKLRRQLDSIEGEAVKALFVAHVETSTGIVNPIEQIGKVAKEKGLIYIVDAAHSLGGIEVRTDDWGVDFCLGGNHKCMSAPAGLSYVAISDRGWKAIERRKAPVKGWYSSLLVWREVWLKRQSGYFTFPATLLFGLRAALDLIFAIGPSELYRSYANVAKAIRYGVTELGLELVASGHNCPGCDAAGRFCADSATAIRYPPDIRHEDFSRVMRDEYNISIGGTYGPLAGGAFRVGPTGLLQVRREFALNLLGCLGLALRHLGCPSDVDRALTVADTILADSRSSRAKIAPSWSGACKDAAER